MNQLYLIHTSPLLSVVSLFHGAGCLRFIFPHKELQGIRRHAHALFLHLRKCGQDPSNLLRPGRNQVVVQGYGQHGEYDLGRLFRVLALDGALVHALAYDIGQYGLELGDDDAGKLLVDECAFLLFIKGADGFLAPQFRGRVQTGIVKVINDD